MKNLLITVFFFFCATGLLHAGEDWKEVLGQHFIIYYQKAPIDFVKNVNKAAEQEYEEIAETLGFRRYEGWTWDKRARIYIYDDQDHYVRERNISWSHGNASTREKIIRTFPTAHGFFDSTLPHELGHIIFREFVGYKSQIPLWLDEGVAMYQEKARRFGADKEVKEAIRNETFIPLGELGYSTLSNDSSPEIVALFYAESASIVAFMINDSQYRFVNFCRQLQQGNRFDDALHRAFVRYKNVEDLNRNWKDYLSR